MHVAQDKREEDRLELDRNNLIISQTNSIMAMQSTINGMKAAGQDTSLLEAQMAMLINMNKQHSPSAFSTTILKRDIIAFKRR